ncbi:MAG: MraY family glycosyltransferase [Patescibacteria group bacterium]|nr:undecaprenyl/decaprenyl-phosphate alpha-N-acetylglucosaminyl 1-phosphate transferase [Patescibacteria group bacterium]
MEFIFPAGIAFGLTVVLSLLALIFFPKWKLMDRPRKYGLKRNPIPYYGGLIIFTAFAISVLVFTNFDKHIAGLLLGGFMIMGIGFLDDRFGVNPFIRLAVQFLAGVVIVLSGIGINSITNPLGGTFVLDQYKIPFEFNGIFYHLTLLADLFTILWVILLTNTMNFLDGIDGLPSGVTAIAAFTIFLLSTRSGIHYGDQTQVAMLAIILFAVCLAFLIFDFSPARMLMGDTGSTFLGFTLAILAIFSGGKIATTFLVLGIPILDALWVIIRRILQKKSPMKGDLKHLHHRFLIAGLTKRQTLLVIYAFCVAFGLVAVYTGSLMKLVAVFGLLFLMVIVGGVVVYWGKRNRI